MDPAKNLVIDRHDVRLLAPSAFLRPMGSSALVAIWVGPSFVLGPEETLTPVIMWP